MVSAPTLAAVLFLTSTPPTDSVAEPLPPSTQHAQEYEVSPPLITNDMVESITSEWPSLSSELAEKAAAAPQQSIDDAADAGQEIVVTGNTEFIRADPLQEVNIVAYQAVQAVDQAVVAPIAKGYQAILPEPVRDGLGNALRNISEPVNFLNFLLQLKIGKALETVGRFVINSTLGVAGLFDVAKTKAFNLPYRRNGFGNTMGFYGIGPGPFFYLPLIGPTTLRDLAGNSLDILVVPTLVGKPFNRPAYAIPANVVMQLNARIERDEEIQRLQNESLNPYAEMRSLYLEMRQNEIDALKNKRKIAVPMDPTAAALPAPPTLDGVPQDTVAAPMNAPETESAPTLPIAELPHQFDTDSPAPPAEAIPY